LLLQPLLSLFHRLLYNNALFFPLATQDIRLCNRCRNGFPSSK
jgi:hypothetical protein